MDSPNPASFRQSEGLYQHLFDSAPDVLMMIDPDGLIQVANSRCLDLLEYESQAMCGRLVQDLMVEAARAAFEVMLTGLRDGTEMPEVEVLILTGQGHCVPMMLDVRGLGAESPGRFLVRLRDLREVKALEQEYRNLFDSIGDAVFIGDPESGQVYQANRQACEQTGYTPGELMGMEYDRVHSERWEAVLEGLRAAGGLELNGREMTLRAKDGQTVEVEIHLRVVPRGEDRIYIETVFDISVRKALETRMKELRAEWDSFIRHELRNPLTPILAFSQMLIEDYPEVRRSAKVLNYLEAIWHGGKRLERLLDLTWEVQAYEQGQIPLRHAEGNLYDTLHEAVTDAALDTGASDAERVRVIVHEGAGDSPVLPVFHDPEKLQRALANLVKNALEHDPGEVTVSVEDGPGTVAVRVHNGGAPIPPEQLDTIFEKFNTTKREQKGTGLGTTIAKLFVEAHNGHIEVASSECEGTTFSVRIPKADRDCEKQMG